MATKEIMPDPICLIENLSNGQLAVNPKALAILSGISQRVVVVTIVGPYRTGKSYLMNQLAGQKKGFSLGSTVQAHTKGIWMWCVPHPTKKDHTLVLLDTEGLGDVEKGNPKNDSWNFALAVLLSSTLVYNSMGTINQQAMDQLHYVSELTKHIRTRAGPSLDGVDDSAEFVSFFPDFVWTVRDFTLELNLDGHPITEDEYLENALQLKRETDEEAKLFNLPRRGIRQFFPTHKCFVFVPPTNWKKLKKLEELQESDLETEFLEQEERFCSYIFQYAKTKTTQGDIVINGTRLESLVVTYVETISSGGLPCMENVVLVLAEIENSAAVKKALACYEKLMSQLRFPTNTLQELLDFHAVSESKALEVFMESCFKDEGQKFQKELGNQLLERMNDFCKKNEKMSTDHSWVLIQKIFQPLEEAVMKGTFSKPGGYTLFLQMKQKLKKKYNQEPDKGLQAEETLLKYLRSKEDMEEAILQTDKLLSEKDKEMAVEKAKSKTAEQEAKLLQKVREKNQQMLEQKEKSYQEHVRQLTRKMEEEWQHMLAEQEKAISLKLKEQTKLVQEGLHNESKQIQVQIHCLQSNCRSSSSKSSCIII
ncbi:guanylate-binding protein 1 [Ornithorhynchus anatinus]|uniref:Guanylate binding protein 2 n=1 Tax=Ornithorhynchus anatinus TaxID=9258 RepID=F7DJQ2_ORNAN|nr:guanylate-binding protein 1 [Ornithorhynchus anatinus]XP_039767815.1 guanylate-binding protein 1 [Ornithorhynchus anatinus]